MFSTLGVSHLLLQTMIVVARFFVLSLHLFYFSNSSLGQGNKTVLWHTQADAIGSDQVVLKFTATIAQGWHLYSQHISEGGPMPTRFLFENCDDYILMGQMEEKGEATKFKDDTYEMEITWYTGVVSFVQRLNLKPQSTKIKGTIEFMTCNDHTCMPGKQDFNVDLLPKQKTP